MKRPLEEFKPRPSVVDLRARPPKAVDVLQATETESDSDLKFDPMIDIDKETRERIYEDIRHERLKENWFTFGLLAKDFLILYPERRIDLALSEETFRNMCRDLAAVFQVQVNGMMLFCEEAASVSFLFPGRKILGEKEFRPMKDALVDFCLKKQWPIFRRMAVSLLILYPDRRREFGLDDTVFDELKTWLETCRNGSWRDFGNMAAGLSILYPDRKADLKLSDSDFEAMKRKLNEYKNRNMLYFLELAFNMKVLAAERVDVTSSGQFKFIYKPKALVKPRKPLPDRSRIQVSK